MATIYIETSIVSYLTSRLSTQVVQLARQMMTRHWWENDRDQHELFASEYVVLESSEGDPGFAKMRLDAIAHTELLDVDPQIPAIANELISRSVLPEKALLDALHISTAAFHGIEYLLTWNCKHIANAMTLPRVYRLLDDLGLATPLICTIEEMIGDDFRIE
jgi:predicted nucleic acid-binding protein